MSRIIKFRAWDGETMWYPDTITNDGNQTNLTFFNPDRGIKWGLYDSRLENRVVSGEHHHLMQFTGLTDKNGKEIYEGDIVKLDDIICEVTWKDAAFHIITNESQGASVFVQDRAKKFEVIGNVFENPSLTI